MEKLNLHSSGQGQVMVLVHGFCENNRLWDDIAPTLAANYRVVRAEMPGFGDSPLAGEPGEVSIEIMADRLAHTLTEAGIEKFTLIGHSMGGYLSLAFAEKYADMLEGLGLFHSTAYADNEEKKENRLKQAEFVKNNGVEPFVKTLIPALFAASQDRQPHIAAALERAGQCTPEAIINALHAMRNRPDRTHILKSSEVPVLMIAGDEDTVIPPEKISLQASFSPRCQFTLLRQSGHMGMVEEPWESVLALEEFMGFVKSMQGY